MEGALVLTFIGWFCRLLPMMGSVAINFGRDPIGVVLQIVGWPLLATAIISIIPFLVYMSRKPKK